MNEAIPHIFRDVFGRIFLTLRDGNNIEFLHNAEFARVEGASSHICYYSLDQLDGSN